MRVKNKKTGKWVELPDPEPTPKEEYDMVYRKGLSEISMIIHDQMPARYRKETWNRGY